MLFRSIVGSDYYGPRDTTQGGSSTHVLDEVIHPETRAIEASRAWRAEMTFRHFFDLAADVSLFNCFQILSLDGLSISLFIPLYHPHACCFSAPFPLPAAKT